MKGVVMADRVVLTMTDIPGDLGKSIISQIRNSKKPSRDILRDKVQDMKLRILAKETHEHR